jgi:hypothetical protein
MESTAFDQPMETDDVSSAAVFERRILPIFQSQRPSSCVECHLSGVDLKDYLRPTQAETFAALLAAGMIDTDRPDDSKILRFIDRRPEDGNLVIERVRQQELEAFRDWMCVRDIRGVRPMVRDARPIRIPRGRWR